MLVREPDFVIGGATLGGTRALINVLSAHPQIAIPRLAEAKYFQPGKTVNRNRRALHDIFEDAAAVRYKSQIPPNRRLHGEEEFDPIRAFEGAPFAKVIFTLRNPVLRCFMQYHNARALGREASRTFEQAIEAELVGVRTPENSNRCWIYKNQYQKHLEHWLSVYPRHKIKVMICEEWSVGLNHGLGDLESFLGLSESSLYLENAFGFKGRERANFFEKLLPKIIDYPPMAEKTQRQLEDIFAVDINYIENLLGRRILSWS